MRIYTSYFAKQRELQRNGVVPIAICLSVPSWFSGKVYQKLALSGGLLREWKDKGCEDSYVRRYYFETLHDLNAAAVVADLSRLAGRGNDIALLCYERSEDFCHRHLVAEWLEMNGYECEEWRPS